MIQSRDPMGVTRPAIRPGRAPELMLEPLEQVSTRDPTEFVAACLSCPLPKCRMTSQACPIFGYSPDVHKEKRKRREKP